MNRGIALFLALVVLLAHTLAIYTSTSGGFAPPYDFAHVAFRMAYNWVHSGLLAWNTNSPIGESYPSLAWVLVATIGERLYVSVTSFCQITAILAALATVLIVAKFSPGRLAGVIAPLLFVVSGPIAAAAGSGTEMTTAALFLTLSFLAWENGWKLTLAVALTVTAMLRTECAVMCAVLFLFELVHSRRHGIARSRWLPFAAPVIALAIAAWMRWYATGSLSSPAGEDLTVFDLERVRRGGNFLRDFLVASGGPALIVIAVWYGVRGALDGIGVRALLLSLAWSVMIGWMGGGPLPFFGAMVPILPIWFVAVQEGAIVALDSKRRWLPEVAWTLFLLGLAASGMASKFPGDFGPLRTESWHRAWMQPHTTGPFGYSRPLGRLGLQEEIANTERLRALGIFFRGQLYHDDTVLTAWPGAVGYLSRLQIADVLGRATPPPGSEKLRPWTALPRADVVAALKQKPTYIVPMLQTGGRAPSVQNVAEAWVKRLDEHPDDKGRPLEILELLREYELFTVALGPSSLLAGSPVDDATFLLRRKDLNLAPKLLVERNGDRWDVAVQHRACEQLVDLRVQLVDSDRRAWSLRPDGTLSRDSSVLARRSLIVFPSGARAVELFSFEIPTDPHFVELRVELRNPNATGEGPFSEACADVVRAL